MTGVQQMSNTSHKDAVKVNVLREYAIYDLLPHRIRRLFQEAPDDFEVEPIAQWYLERLGAGNSIEYLAYEIKKMLR